MAFRRAVQNTPQIANCYQNGKSALGINSVKVREANPRSLSGSVELDACLLRQFPTANRWDYVVGYNNVAYFMEVHHASTSEVDTMINKLNWLKNWLRTDGTYLDAIKASNPYHWVFTNKNTISKGSTYERRLVRAGLGMPKRELVLP